MEEMMKPHIDSNDLVSLIKSSTQKDLNKLVKQIISNSLKVEKNLKNIYTTFSSLYDNIYHDLLFKRINIDKKMVKILETLAMPIYEKPEKEQRHIINDIIKKTT